MNASIRRLICNEKGEVSFTKIGSGLQSFAISLGGIPLAAQQFNVEVGLPKDILIAAVVVWSIGKWIKDIGVRDATKQSF